MTPVADRLVGPYRLLREIGVGGMGEVHLALDPRGRTVAVKILHPAVARDEVSRRRLEREVATMRKVQNPHVAEVLDADFAAARPYIVTRYVQGRPLNEVVKEDGVLRGPALVRLALGLARAVTAMHAAGIVHRDVKPGNVMLVDGDPVVIDFGLAQVLDATRLTLTGTAIGTPGYLAPEVLDGHRAGPEADVFSWASTVVFGAVGASPFGAGPPQAVFSRVLRGRFDVSALPEPLRSLVASALDRESARRPTAAALLVAFEDGMPTTQYREPRVVRPAPAPPPRDHIGILLLPAVCYAVPTLAAVSLLLACAVIYLRDALAWARRRVRSSRGGLLVLIAAVAGVPLRVLIRVGALVVVLTVGWAVVLAATIPLADGARAWALPGGLIAVLAGSIRSWFDPRPPKARRFLVPVVMLAVLALCAAAVPEPLWWPLSG